MNKCVTVVIAVLVCGAVGVVCFARSGADEAKGVKKELINPENLYRSPYYTQAVAVRGGKTIHISGQWSHNDKGELVGKNDMTAQAKQAFKNLKLLLTACKATPADVVKINVYMVGYQGKDIAALDEGLKECFGADRGFASTVVGVQALAKDGMLVEVEALVVVE